MGKNCSKVHFIITDPDFTREVKTQNQKFEQFYIRKLTIGPDVTDYIRLTKPPRHPFKKKKNLNKFQQAEESEKIKKEFIGFIPEFHQLSKVCNIAVVKSNCVVYPVIDSKSKKLKMILQLDIPRTMLQEKPNAQSIEKLEPLRK